MKKVTLFLLTMVLLSFHFIHAQNSSPYWSLAGNSNATTTSKLGTTTQTPLYLITKNTTRLYISPSAGYVGIGTTAPSSQFQVNAPSGVSPMRLLINGSIRMLASSNGGLTVGNGTAPPAQGLYVSSNTGIGTATPLYKLHVEGGSSGAAIYGNNTGTGLYGKSSGSLGVYGASTYSSGDGVHGEATGSVGYGVYAYSSSSYGIYARTGNSTSYAGFFSGNVYTTGSYQPSARKLKQNITDLNSALAIISKLQPKEYEYKQDGNYKLMNLPQGKRYGLIAEEVEQVLPGLVKESEFDPNRAVSTQPGAPTATASEKIDFKALNYTELIPIIVKGMQEQEAENKELKQQVGDQQQQINELRQMVLELKNGTTTISPTNATLSQAVPNPVSGTTRISYNLPTGSKHAQLLVTDVTGIIVRSIVLNKSGSVDVNTVGLSSGTYNYALYVDSKHVDTKRLVIAR